MLIVIPGVLNGKQLEQVRSLLEAGHFVDGRLSAGKTAKRSNLLWRMALKFPT